MNNIEKYDGPKLAGFEVSIDGLDHYLNNEAAWQGVLKDVKTGQKLLSLVVDEDAATGIKTVLLIPANDSAAKEAFANGKISYRAFIEQAGAVRLGHLNPETGTISAWPLQISEIPEGILSNLEHSCDFVATKEWYDRRMSRYASRFG